MYFKILTFYIFFLIFFVKSDDSLIHYYEKLIIQAKTNVTTYKLPTDASQYKPINDNPPEDFGTYDFIIVGSGSSGSVVANRLSANSQFSVLLLEAGDYGNNLTDIPGMLPYLQYSDYNWGFKTIPQSNSCLGFVDKKCAYPRGKGIGGTSLINGLIYSRSSPTDYDKLSELLQDPSWSYNEVLPLFEKSENLIKSDLQAPVDFDYHGLGGPLNVEFHQPRSHLLDVFLKANEELDINLIDYNSEDVIGVSPYQLTTLLGRRMDCGKAFIKRITSLRSNLKVLTKSYVTKILINETTKTAYGVEFTRNGILYHVKVQKEVIISAGAISSPQLLMLSGIGPEEHLTQLGIKVIQNLEVGSKLLDHATFFGITVSHNSTISPAESLPNMIKDYLLGIGPLTLDNQGLGFYQSDIEETPDYPNPDLEITPVNVPVDSIQKFYNFSDEIYHAVWGNTKGDVALTFFIIALHIKSFGTIRLNSTNAFDYPDIDPRYLSDPLDEDIETLYQGIQMVLKFLETDEYKKINATLRNNVIPPCKNEVYLSKAYWYCAIRYLMTNTAHPISTCPIGLDPAEGAVVDAEFKVHGVENLRVVDASVFPFTLSGHTNAPCIMIGEKASKLIINGYL